jgi:hypothetical protein
MKKQILISLFSLFSLSVFAQIPNYVPANGLVGWWPFNGNANDESGNGNNGTVNGATLTQDRFGNANMAYSFNGSTNFIVINQNFQSINGITISCWVNITSFNQPPQSYVNFSDNGQVGVGLHFDQTQQKNIGYSPTVNIPSTNIMSNNVWRFLTITIDVQNNLTKYYENGILDGQLTSSNFVLNLNELNIGRHHSNVWGYDWYMNGKIDDIGMWNRALTVCEIQNLYTSQINSTFVSAGADQTICNGEQVTLSASNSQNYTWNNGVTDTVSFSPTTTQDYIVTADTAGCLSSDTVTVYVNQPSSSTLNQTALDSYTLNGQTYTQSGTYTQTVPSANGCDSVITLNLTLNFTGISENTTAQISISPNPASSKIIVKSDVALIGSKFIIYDALGKEVKSGKLTTIETEVDLSNLYNGVYLFKVGARQLGTFKIIKE